MFDFDLDETVTVLDGIRRKVGDRVQVESAPGIPVVQRVFASMFDMFGHNRPEDPEGFDADAEFRRAVSIADAAEVAVVVAGEWQSMIGERRRGRPWVARTAAGDCRPSSAPAPPRCCW